MDKQQAIKSRQRVSDHGEVFTPPREVNAMLDLVKQETERIDSRFLEPACGTGNFLEEILNRKLAIVEYRHGGNQIEFERYGVLAVSSIYGIDILEDNIEECRARLFAVFEKKYQELYKKKCESRCLESIRFILSKNIIWGDALSLKQVDASKEPIIFSEWSPVNGSMIKRRDYTLTNLLDYQPMDSGMLFSDNHAEAMIVPPIREYQLVHYWKLLHEA